MAVILWVLSRTRVIQYNQGDPILDDYTGEQLIKDGNPVFASEDSIIRLEAEATFALGFPYGRVQCRAIKGGWALCQIQVDDPANVQALKDHPDIFAFMEDDEETIWDYRWQGASLVSPNGRGWNPGKFNRVMNFLESTLGVDTTGLTRDSSLDEILRRVAGTIEPESITS